MYHHKWSFRSAGSRMQNYDLDPCRHPTEPCPDNVWTGGCCQAIVAEEVSGEAIVAIVIVSDDGAAGKIAAAAGDYHKRRERNPGGPTMTLAGTGSPSRAQDRPTMMTAEYVSDACGRHDDGPCVPATTCAMRTARAGYAAGHRP